MSDIHANEVTDPAAELAAWFLLKKEIAEVCSPLIAKERAMRARLFNHFFPTPAEGTNTYVLPDGFQVKGKYPIERKVDPAALAALREVKLVDLPPAMLQEFAIDTSKHTPDEKLTDALLMNVDAMLAYEPKLVVKEYRKLTAEQSAAFQRCLVVAPGSIAMEVVPPSTKGSAPAAAGFGGEAAA